MGQIHRRRMGRLREAFRGEGLDGALLTSLNDIFYYTGKAVSRPGPGFLLVTRDTWTLFVSSLDNSLEGPGVRVLQGFGEMKDALKRAGRLGFDDGNMSVAQHRWLPSRGWRPLSGKLKAIRMVKDSAEIGLLSRSVRSALGLFKGLALDGRTEQQVITDIRVRIAGMGLRPAFDPIVASGKRSAFIHYQPGRVRVTRGLVIVDLGVERERYCSDLTRTFLLDPTAEEEGLVEGCRAIQSELIGMATPGTAFSDIQERYEASLKKLGYPVLHGFGHGVGLGVHERPGRGDTLEKGMVITVEPGMYEKGIGGCRLEDMVLVDKKPKVLP